MPDWKAYDEACRKTAEGSPDILVEIVRGFAEKGLMDKWMIHNLVESGYSRTYADRWDIVHDVIERMRDA